MLRKKKTPDKYPSINTIKILHECNFLSKKTQVNHALFFINNNLC